MKRWLTLPRTGAGTAADPWRPDLQGVPELRGLAVGADAGPELLVLVVGPAGRLAQLAARARADHGQESGGRPAGALRAALRAEAVRLGRGADWQPDGCDVSEE